ncbi:MAG: 3-ketoacyl-ACP reductase [Candidatus Omnitrophica bacterium]|nr:3-ketoacyl-ACP reductase [Candidatus Omnitrophota bacterium]
MATDKKQKKIACITGAAGGIGQAVCVALAKENFTVVAVDWLPQNEGEPVLRELRGSGHVYIQADISRASDRQKIVRIIRQKLGRLDLLVNNAGVAPKHRLDILQTTEESYDRVMNINLKGTFFLTQAVASYMIELVEKQFVFHPRIVNISSISAYTSSVNRAEYCLSKAGISMLTKLFADRLACYGIYVYEVRPGIIETLMTAGVKEKYNRLIFEENLLPIGRWGKPEDVASAIMAIAQGSFDYSTGAVFDIDGGFHLRRL